MKNEPNVNLTQSESGDTQMLTELQRLQTAFNTQEIEEGYEDTTRIRCLQCHHFRLTPPPMISILDWRANRRYRAHIQDAFPGLDASQRELIQSGICGNCFEAIFSPVERQPDSVRVIVIDPTQRSITEKYIVPTLKNLQHEVGGYIEYVHYENLGCDFIVNEDGIGLALPLWALNDHIYHGCGLLTKSKVDEEGESHYSDLHIEIEQLERQVSWQQ